MNEGRMKAELLDIARDVAREYRLATTEVDSIHDILSERMRDALDYRERKHECELDRLQKILASRDEDRRHALEKLAVSKPLVPDMPNPPAPPRKGTDSTDPGGPPPHPPDPECPYCGFVPKDYMEGMAHMIEHWKQQKERYDS